MMLMSMLRKERKVMKEKQKKKKAFPNPTNLGKPKTDIEKLMKHYFSICFKNHS